ncbi:biotin synthase [Cutibacterium acnes JCM 18909]|nr:biotin synthase [Cutibacterium acnes JCM 18909]
MLNLADMTERGLRGESITREEALEILRSSDDELMSIIAAAGKVRRHFFSITGFASTTWSTSSPACVPKTAPIARSVWDRVPRS